MGKAPIIDLYIDLISPYCYLAHTQLPGIADRFGAELVYRPMHIATAKIAAGNFGPSNMEVPSKFAALRRDLERWATRYNVPFNFPRSIAGELWNIALLHSQRAGMARRFATLAFDRLWGEGGDPADPDLLRSSIELAGLDAEETMAFVNSNEGRAAFRKACVEAHQGGIFGAPIMIVGYELFWGNDRLDFLAEHLEQVCAGSAS